jgi:predicted nucleic acid-binding protein
VILYLDTSSLVKLYVNEQGSEDVIASVSKAEAVATCRIAYAEACAAFARKRQNGGLDEGEYQVVLRDFHNDWERFFIIEVSREVTRMAGELAEKHYLRGYDAIHLASAEVLKGKLKSPVAFSCADKRLQKAAKAEGFGTSL